MRWSVGAFIVLGLSLAYTLHAIPISEDWELILPAREPLYFNESLFFGLPPTGALLGVEYSGLELVGGLESKLGLNLEAGYIRRHYYRSADGAQIELPYNRDDIAYNLLHTGWELRIAQGLLWNEQIEENLLELFVALRGRYDHHFDNGSPLFSSGVADRDSILYHSLFAGLELENRMRVAGGAPNGFRAEISAEWAPQLPIQQPSAATDFLRLNGSATFYVPLVESSQQSNPPGLSIYVANELELDWVSGGAHPLAIRGSLGGRTPRIGLGSAVRGYAAGTRDTELKLANNLELRISAPPFPDSQLTPIMLFFLDAGFGFGLHGSPAADNGELLISIGGELHLSIFDELAPGIGIAIPLIGRRHDGELASLLVGLALHI